jgi:menaquinone-dependent protoporphyrinogen oxidase
MSTAIIYCTKHGTAARIALMMKEKLSDESTVINLKKEKDFSISQYDKIVLGGSVYAGRMSGKLKKFAKKYQNELLGKKLALFAVCMDKSDTRGQYLDKNLPAELVQAAIAICFPGAEFYFEKMNFLEKSIIRKITGFTENVSQIDEAAIDEFCRKIESA